MLIAARTRATIDEAVEEVRTAGASAEGTTADIATREGAHALADAAGDIDILVHATCINLRPPMDEVDEDTWDEVMRVNLDAAFILGRRLGVPMAERGRGRIIHVSSQQAQRAFAASGAYGVSKGALEALTRSQAKAWSPHGVTVNALVPGFVPTALNRALAAQPGALESLAARTLVGRNGRADDFAAAAVFRAGDGASYVTGQCLGVDGGFSVH